MKIQQVRLFTYEDVRLALEKHFAVKLAGVNVGGPPGYCIVECEAGAQPSEPEEPKKEEPPPF